jgi:hypothetical protein
MKKLFLLIFLFVFVSGPTLLAQTILITGTVTSGVAGEGPIPGATVIVKGTTLGVLTDLNGKYSISVPVNATTLIISYIGMKTQEIQIAGRTVIDCVLEAELVGLSEVVVTGYGTQRKKDITGAVTNLKSDDFNKG